jgi:hypothetical protein
MTLGRVFLQACVLVGLCRKLTVKTAVTAWWRTGTKHHYACSICPYICFRWMGPTVTSFACANYADNSAPVRAPPALRRITSTIKRSQECKEYKPWLMASPFVAGAGSQGSLSGSFLHWAALSWPFPHFVSRKPLPRCNLLPLGSP